MVYIRSKKVKGIDYAYLVKSEWQGGSKAPKQVTIKYLGKASNVDISDIPEPYRNDPKILSFLSEHNPQDARKNAVMIESFCNHIYDHLSSGQVGQAVQLYKECRKLLSLEDFYDKILRMVMYDIGAKWESGIVDVATEHVASNAATSLISSIIEMDSVSYTATAATATTNNKCILVCCPEGELHHLSALVLESVLRSKGYRVINAAPSLPADSVLHYVDENKPNLIMVSVTLPENIPAAKRLVNKILERFDKQIPIIVGGSAVAKSTALFSNVASISHESNNLKEILRVVRLLIRTPSRE